MNNKVKTLIILGFWLVLAFLFVITNEKVFLTGNEIRLKVQPVDPRDFLRGQYVQLKYDISTVPVKKSENFKSGQIVYTILQRKEGICSAGLVSSTKPVSGIPYIKGRIDHIQWHYKSKEAPNSSDYKAIGIEYGIENLFTKEKEAKEIEKRLKKGGIAVIKLDKNGNAKILRVE